MKPSSWDKQLGLASPLESAASQSGQTNNPSKTGVGLDVSHHTCAFPRGGEKFFFLTSSLSKNLLSGVNLRKLKSKLCCPFAE